LVADGKLELLLAGYYEPILPCLLREDRIDQIGWMREALRKRFGVEARGLWLTERVWEPDLAADLADAGVDYVLLDDRHFAAAGFSKNDLHLPFRTEADGKSLAVFAIDENLRYFLPFHPPEDTATYLRELRASGKRLAVAADDIEKFGGWPGTKEWVYERGWMDDFIRTMKEMEESGEIRLATFGQSLAQLPSGGPAYLPSSSYREMEEWALPPEAFQRLEGLKKEVGEERISKGESPLIRGSHWRNFLVKYPESNRMHKKMLFLSRLCRERGDPEGARRALGAAQCNDVYWHGVFGGLYLRHLRDTTWSKLAEAEELLRTGEALAVSQADQDLDGAQEIRVHSSGFSALVSPARGGAIEELIFFSERVNLANTLTRRREAYHEAAKSEAGDDQGAPNGENGIGQEGSRGGDGSSRLPPVDPDDRALFQERVLPGELELEAYAAGAFEPVHSWAKRELLLRTADEGPERVEVVLGDPGSGELEKSIRFESDGSVEVLYHWNPEGFPEGSFFTTELSLGADAEIVAVPDAVSWRFPISTYSKSERGFDETVQGESFTIRWPVETGWGRIRLTRP
jgi:hypothetical protein